MKTNIKESIKIIVGILLGTGLVMFLIWFMAGGVMLMPPFIVIPILMVLFVVSFIVAGVMKGYKLAIVVVGSFVFGWFGFNAYYKHTCGPNSADVKVMKPMAQKISAYIVKHGIPESLKDIAGLPYGLVGCERSVVFKKHTITKNIDVNSSKNATFKVVSERCKYNNDARVYEVRMRFEYYFKDKSYGGSLYINNWNSETGTNYMYNSEKKGMLENNPHFYSSKSTGICSTFKQ